jgi:hypothetical protein
MAMELPEHLRTGPLAEAAAKALQDAQSMSASSNSVPRLSLKGREFRLVEGGEETAKFRDTLDVVILGVEPGPGLMIKTWYKDGYKSGAKEPPTCSSDDGIAPAMWVTDKQAQTCKACPKNQFGSAISPNGKPTKACRDSKRVWFKLAEGNKEIMPPGQEPQLCAESKKPFAERTLYGANVTVASLKAFAEHGRALQALGQGPAVCVTRMVMLDKEFPELEFKLQAWLDADTAPQSLKIAADRPWKVYSNAGLALAGPEGGSKGGLPTALPGVPEHLKQAAQAAAPEAQGSQSVVDATPAAAKPVGDIDDAIGKW